MYSLGTGMAQDDIAAHIWFNISNANGGGAAESRDRVAVRLTPADLSKAQRRAKMCMASNYQDCD